MSLHLPHNVSVTLQLVSKQPMLQQLTTKGTRPSLNQNKTSLPSTLLQFLCLAKLTQKAFHPLLSHESPTDYDPAKLLLLSDHFVVKGFYVEEEQSKHKADQVFMFCQRKMYNPSTAFIIFGFFTNFVIRKKT